MWPVYKQHVREFVKGGRAALVNHSFDEGLCPKDTRNRPSGDPNCGLFPQGPIIPVPPNTPPYRPVGMCGNNWAVPPGRHEKRKPPNQRVRRPLFPLFRWRLCAMATPKQHQAILGSTKTRVQKPVSAIPTLSCSFVAAPFQLGLVWLSVLSTLPPNPSACLRVGVWDKPWDKFANYFETASSQFHFLSRGQKRQGFEAHNRPKRMTKGPIFLFGACLAK